MTVVTIRGYSWISEEQGGVAHAHPARSRATRTLCGLPALDARWAKPAALRCGECITEIERKDGVPFRR